MSRKKLILKQYIWVTVGVICIAFSYYFLFRPLYLVTGGVTGLSIILDALIKASWFKVSYVIYALNIVLLFVGLFALGKDFFLKTIYGSLLLPTITYILELCKVSPSVLLDLDTKLFGMEAPSQDVTIILAVLVGGVIMGFGLGVAYKNNGSTGGMDVIQKMMSKYLHVPFSLCVYLTDGIMVVASIFVFGLTKTLFAFITILIVGNVADYIEMGGRIRRTAFIISKEQDKIKDFVINNLERGVTVTKVIGGYSQRDFDMLICTMSKRESYILRDYILQVDPGAFTFYVSAREVYGDGFD